MNTVFSRTGIWVFILVPIFGAVVFALIWSLRPLFSGQQRCLRRFIFGFVVFVGSAAGVEVISNFFEKGTAGYIAEVSFEELGEMVGVKILLWATIELLQAHRISVSRLFGLPGGDHEV